MPLTLDSTLSSTTGESYVSVATCDTYHTKRSGNTAWSALDNDDKIRALIGATDLLERLDYWGEKTVATQALKFPRIYRTASDGSSIPREVEHAVCELALFVATNTSASATAQTRRANLRGQGVISFRLGDLSETYAETGSHAVSGTSGTLAEMPAAVQRLISGWVKMGGNSDSGRRLGYGYNYDENGLWWPNELI